MFKKLLSFLSKYCYEVLEVDGEVVLMYYMGGTKTPWIEIGYPVFSSAEDAALYSLELLVNNDDILNKERKVITLPEELLFNEAWSLET